MASRNDSLTLILNGEVSLQDFAKTMEYLQALVAHLTREMGKDVRWVISELAAGSAMATVTGYASDAESVPAIVSAFDVIGEKLASGSPIPYSPKIREAAHKLTSIIDGEISSLILKTASQEHFIGYPSATDKPRGTQALGTLTGKVEALNSHHEKLRFTLYDDLFYKAIACYFREEHRETVRAAWDKRVSVTGRIWREPLSGRAVRIDEISEIVILPEHNPDPEGYRMAAGAWGAQLFNDERPEDTLRRIRDDE